MTSWLIELGLSKVEGCKSRDLFCCQIKNCSATSIPSLSIMGCHPWPTGSLMKGGYSSAEVQSVYSTAPADWAIERKREKNGWTEREETEYGFMGDQ